MRKKLVDPTLLQHLQNTKNQLDTARCFYNQVSDPNLVAACIYEINALQARYSQLISLAKSAQISCHCCVYPVKQAR